MGLADGVFSRNARPQAVASNCPGKPEIRVLLPEIVGRQVRKTLEVLLALPQPLFRLLALGDVPDDADRVPFSVGVHPGNRVLGDDLRSVLAQPGQFQGLSDDRPLACAAESIKPLFKIGTVAFRDNQLVELLSLRFLRAVAENPLRRFIPEGDLPGVIHHDDGVPGGGADNAESLIREPVLRKYLPHHVHRGDDEQREPQPHPVVGHVIGRGIHAAVLGEITQDAPEPLHQQRTGEQNPGQDPAREADVGKSKPDPRQQQDKRQQVNGRQKFHHKILPSRSRILIGRSSACWPGVATSEVSKSWMRGSSPWGVITSLSEDPGSPAHTFDTAGIGRFRRGRLAFGVGPGLNVVCASGAIIAASDRGNRTLSP